MPAERRERAIAIWLGSTGNGKNPMFNGRRQPPCGGTSRMTRECQVRFCEGLGVKFPGPTRPIATETRYPCHVRFPPESDRTADMEACLKGGTTSHRITQPLGTPRVLQTTAGLATGATTTGAATAGRATQPL